MGVMDDVIHSKAIKHSSDRVVEDMVVEVSPNNELVSLVYPFA